MMHNFQRILTYIAIKSLEIIIIGVMYAQSSNSDLSPSSHFSALKNGNNLHSNGVLKTTVNASSMNLLRFEPGTVLSHFSSSFSFANQIHLERDMSTVFGIRSLLLWIKAATSHDHKSLLWSVHTKHLNQTRHSFVNSYINHAVIMDTSICNHVTGEAAEWI